MFMLIFFYSYMKCHLNFKSLNKVKDVFFKIFLKRRGPSGSLSNYTVPYRFRIFCSWPWEILLIRIACNFHIIWMQVILVECWMALLLIDSLASGRVQKLGFEYRY
jgi:hypothetical protein